MTRIAASTSGVIFEPLGCVAQMAWYAPCKIGIVDSQIYRKGNSRDTHALSLEWYESRIPLRSGQTHWEVGLLHEGCRSDITVVGKHGCLQNSEKGKTLV